RPYDALTQGAGELNAQGAVALASAIDPSVRSGEWWLRNSVPTQTVVAAVPLAWTRNIIWGNNIVWGDLLFQNSGAWSIAVEWGDSTFHWSDVARVEPTNVVWGDITLWASNIVWGNHL